MEGGGQLVIFSSPLFLSIAFFPPPLSSSLPLCPLYEILYDPTENTAGMYEIFEEDREERIEKKYVL